MHTQSSAEVHVLIRHALAAGAWMIFNMLLGGQGRQVQGCKDLLQINQSVKVYSSICKPAGCGLQWEN